MFCEIAKEMMIFDGGRKGSEAKLGAVSCPFDSAQGRQWAAGREGLHFE